jgi:hypothetical protein
MLISDQLAKPASPVGGGVRVAFLAFTDPRFANLYVAERDGR